MLQAREHVRATMARTEVDAALRPTRAKLLQQHERFVASNRLLAIPPAERCQQPEPLAMFEEGELIGSGGQGAVRHSTFWPKGAAGTGYASTIKCGVARADAMAQDPLLFFAESSIAAAQGESEFVAPMQGCDVRPLIVRPAAAGTRVMQGAARRGTPSGTSGGCCGATWRAPARGRAQSRPPGAPRPRRCGTSQASRRGLSTISCSPTPVRLCSRCRLATLDSEPYIHASKRARPRWLLDAAHAQVPPLTAPACADVRDSPFKAFLAYVRCPRCIRGAAMRSKP